MILGGKKVLYYELAPPPVQLKAKGKQGRIEKKTRAAVKSGDALEIQKAKEKEDEREWKKRKATGWVEWPWSTVVAWCFVVEGRYIIGDTYGKLAMLSIDPLDERKLTLLALGEVRLTPCLRSHVFLG